MVALSRETSESNTVTMDIFDVDELRRFTK